MKKPFKEWGVVKFLTNKVPKAAGKVVGEVADVALRGESPLKAISDLLTGDDDFAQLSPEDIAKARELAQMDFEREKAYLKDIQDARGMQTEIGTSQHSTRLSKNFIYYFAMGVAGSMLIIVLLLFFIQIPEDNKRIIDMLLGAFVGILVSIGTFFYGSSMGSKNKETALTGIAQRAKETMK